MDHPPSDSAPESLEYALDELRALLVGSEQDRLVRLQDRLDNPQNFAQEVSQVLPDALQLGRARNRQLLQALLPLLEEALLLSVKKNPRILIDILFPIIGPVIRKSIAQALQGVTQSLNRTLELSLSAQSWRWRWEAWRTGTSFAEVVLVRTLIFRVEQILLIHRETGLLLEQLGNKLEDADLVSGMLTAIQDFVNTAFQAKAGSELDTLQMGDLTVWIEVGPKAVIAAVVRNTPPHTLRATLKEAIEDLHVCHGEELNNFQGQAFAVNQEVLQSEYGINKPAAAAIPRLKWPYSRQVVGLAVSLGLALLLWRGLIQVQHQHAWQTYVNQLRSTAGLVVVYTNEQNGTYMISGLRDPLAQDPQTLLTNSGLDPAQIISNWEPYQSLQPSFVLKRAQALLQPPPGVTLSLKDGILYTQGSVLPS